MLNVSLLGVLMLAMTMPTLEAIATPAKRTFGARHGHSRANKKGLIVSRLEHGVKKRFGLEKSKIESVRREASIKINSLKRVKTIVVSPFSRTRQTGQLIRETMVDHGISQPDIIVDVDAAERNFGNLELLSDKRYVDVWIRDRIDPSHRDFGAESVRDVYKRGLRVLERADNMRGDVLVVSHGDWLQILKTGMMGLPLHRHRDLFLPKGWQTGQVHPLTKRFND